MQHPLHSSLLIFHAGLQNIYSWVLRNYSLTSLLFIKWFIVHSQGTWQVIGAQPFQQMRHIPTISSAAANKTRAQYTLQHTVHQVSKCNYWTRGCSLCFTPVLWHNTTALTHPKVAMRFLPRSWTETEIGRVHQGFSILFCFLSNKRNMEIWGTFYCNSSKKYVFHCSIQQRNYENFNDAMHYWQCWSFCSEYYDALNSELQFNTTLQQIKYSTVWR